MRAVVYDRQGTAAEVLHVVDLPKPEPGPGEVRVRVSFSAINPTDWKARRGATPRPIQDFQIPHHDGSGVIDAVGEGVDAGRIGERVWLWLAAFGRKWGTAAQWTVVPEWQAVRLPDRASLELGACLGVPALTAHRCLFADGELAGRTVLVAGGAGAVGHYAIQLAKRAGARVVTTVSSPEKADLAHRAGADLVVNYREADALGRIRSFAESVDRVAEVNLSANLQLDLALSHPETVVVVYAADAQDPVLPVRACMTANVTVRFVLLYGVPTAELHRGVLAVSAALEAGALTELPLHRFSLDECAAAQDAVEQGAVGKVLLEIG